MSATNRGTVRVSHDHYATPGWCVDAILEELDRYQLGELTFLEPCAAEGAILHRAEDLFRSADWAEIRLGRDYLAETYRADVIITNPPYSLAREFVGKTLHEAGTVCHLLRLNFLGSQKRKMWWQGREPSHVFVLSRRPSFTGNGTDATEYAWFVWDRLGIVKRNPGIWVI